MKFIVDENAGPSVAKWLVSFGYKAFSIYDKTPDISDDEILKKAREGLLRVGNYFLTKLTCHKFLNIPDLLSFDKCFIGYNQPLPTILPPPPV